MNQVNNIPEFPLQSPKPTLEEAKEIILKHFPNAKEFDKTFKANIYAYENIFNLSAEEKDEELAHFTNTENKYIYLHFINKYLYTLNISRYGDDKLIDLPIYTPNTIHSPFIEKLKNHIISKDPVYKNFFNSNYNNEMFLILLQKISLWENYGDLSDYNTDELIEKLSYEYMVYVKNGKDSVEKYDYERSLNGDDFKIFTSIKEQIEDNKKFAEHAKIKNKDLKEANITREEAEAIRKEKVNKYTEALKFYDKQKG